MAVNTLQGRTAEASAEWPGWPVGRNLSTALTSVFSSRLWGDWSSLCKWRNWEMKWDARGHAATRPETGTGTGTATGARVWPCSPALSSLPDKPVGRQQSKDLRWNFSAPPHLPAEASEDPSPGHRGRLSLPSPWKSKRFWFCSLLAGSSVKGGEGRGIWGVDEGEREGEKERDRREERQAIYLPAKSGFSMETRVPVCLKMPLKKKIVNHFPPRRQRWLPGFDSWIWKTFLSIIPMPAPT